mmetsp:Transcript_46893/g.74055  ORF Transcript_46893/g.74055 Transcript_46893/m.74055 type:complete len:105 (-) Transcript_46893:1087-1401(-)
MDDSGLAGKVGGGGGGGPAPGAFGGAGGPAGVDGGATDFGTGGAAVVSGGFGGCGCEDCDVFGGAAADPDALNDVDSAVDFGNCCAVGGGPGGPGGLGSGGSDD